MPLFRPDYLADFCRRIFYSAGVPDVEAGIVASRLVEANSFGHDSHGIIRVPQYLGAIAEGDVVPGAEIETAQEITASATLDGNWGFGQVVAGQAVTIGAEKARASGLSVVTFQNSYHIGRKTTLGKLWSSLHK